MKSHYETYCQISFLDNLCLQMIDLHATENYLDDDSKLEIVRNIYKLIHSRSYLLLDCTKQELVERSQINEFFKIIIKKEVSGGCCINFNKNSFSELLRYIETRKLLKPGSLIYHVQDNEWMKQTNEQCSIYNINNDTINHEYSNIFKSKSYYVSKNKKYNTFSGWHILSEFNLPITQIIVKDLYILKKKEELDFNICRIISNLLPKTNSCEINISIFILRYSLNLNVLEERLRYLEEHVRKTKINYKVNFSICQIDKSDQHDRIIITDYFIIKSHHSFDFYNPKGEIKRDRNTTLEVEMIGCPSAKERFDIEIDQIKNYKENCKMGIDYIGNLTCNL